MNRRLRVLAPYALIVAAVLLFFWPVWLAGATFPVGGGDLFGQLLPVWSYISRFLRRGTLPLWSTQMMAGDPIVGEPQYGIFNPLNWWLFIVGADHRGLILLRGMLPLTLAGAGVYTYLRKSSLWQLRVPAALVGAFAYMLSDPFITHLGHPQMNDAMAWLPWTLLGVDTIIDKRRVVIWPTLVFAGVVLTGHYQSALLTAAGTGLYALWRFSFVRPARWAKTGGRLALSLVCATALTLPAVLPSLERYPYTERAILQLEPWRGYQWPLEMAIDLVAPGFHGRGTLGFWAPWARVEGGYAGALTVFLALGGLLLSRRYKRTGFVVLLGTLGLLFALGHDGPIYPWLAEIDLVARMHKTARSIFLLAFALSLAGAAGFEALTSAKRFGYVVWVVAVVGLSAALVFGTSSALAAVPGDRQADAVMALSIAAGAGLMVVLMSWTLRRGAADSPIRCLVKAGIPILLLGELILTGTGVELEATHPNPAKPAIAYLRSDPNWFRVDVDAAARGLLSPAVLLAEGFEVPQGSGNPMELFSYSQFYWAVPYKGAPVYQLLGAKYIIVPNDALPGGEGIWPVFTEAPIVDVHLNTNALPRVWLVYHTVPVTNIEEANAIVFDESFEPALTATLEGGPKLDEAGTGSLEVAAYGANRVEVIVRTTTDALLTISDLHYPGWHATVNGVPTEIHKTNGIFRGVVVPAGEHRVQMRYHPTSVQLGLGAAGMATLILTVAADQHRRRHGATKSQVVLQGPVLW